MLRSITRKIFSWYIPEKKKKQTRHINLVPVVPRHNDLYLVAFPKSGITWLSFLMANIEIEISAQNININFFNIIDFVADIHTSRNINERELAGLKCRLIKSHSEANPYYKKLIYLVRDPRAVMISYFHFLKNQGDYNGDITDFIKDPRYGIENWNRHVNSWVNESRLDQKIIFVKYEDLHGDSLKTMNNLFRFMGLDIQAGIIQRAVTASSFVNMKRCEDLVREYDVRRGRAGEYRNFEFVRAGETNQFNDLSSDDIAYINQRCNTMMKLFEYL